MDQSIAIAELGLETCERCLFSFLPEQMMRPGSRFRDGCDVYADHPTCKVCGEESSRD